MSCSAWFCTLQKFQSPDRQHLSSQSGLFLAERAQLFARQLSCWPPSNPFFFHIFFFSFFLFKYMLSIMLWPSLNLNFFIFDTSFLQLVNEIVCTKSPRLGGHSISNSLLSLIYIQNEWEGEVLESELCSSSGYFIFHEVSP